MPRGHQYHQIGIDIDRLLSTNLTPTQTEASTLRRSSLCCEERIRRIDQYIASVQEHLDRLRVDRNEELQLQAIYSQILSPLRTMPSEVLEQIFLFAASQRLSSRMVVSHVCRHWRHTALGCSQLWSTVDGDAQGLNSQSHLAYIATILTRAHNQPLSMTRTKAPLSKFSNGAMAIVNSLRRHSWRELSWRNMDFVCFDAVVHSLNIGRQHETQLERLDLHCVPDAFFHTDGHPQINQNSGIMRFRNFRNLTHLSLFLCYHLDFSSLSAPWQRLTHLSLNAVGVDQSPLLQTMLPSVPTMASPTTLPHLQRMHLTSGDPAVFNWMAERCATPNLEELVVDAGFNTFELMNVEGLSNFILINSETLRRLWITGIGDLSQAEMDLITQLVSLEELTLVVNDFVDGTALGKLKAEYIWPPILTHVELNTPISATASPIDLYLNDTRNTVPCPCLRVLRLVCPLERNSTVPRHFSELMRTRWWPDSDDDFRPLRPIPRLNYATLQQRVSLERMRADNDLNSLIEKGLNLNIFTPTIGDLSPGFWS
ncbi:hypothetical protein D9619_006794 [Psilocybe cf. subviscida]|uniref:F-box domain-containing protein n=1 Tax=Psilocybe cf. subviscida TaxID=2480587 RepID=A0A8H5B499_9AGAR|nr:hypothetical protein D9619_006794 [Psilocybe cf. subviscida]